MPCTQGNFKTTSVAFLDQLCDWAAGTGLASLISDPRVVVVVDHGLAPGACIYRGVGVVFAGARRTADDVIASAARSLTEGFCTDGEVIVDGADVLVATSDRELSGRCISAGRAGSPGRGKRREAAERRERAEEALRCTADGATSAKKAVPCNGQKNARQDAPSPSLALAAWATECDEEGRQMRPRKGSVQVVPSPTFLGVLDFVQQQAQHAQHNLRRREEEVKKWRAGPTAEEEAGPEEDPLESSAPALTEGTGGVRARVAKAGTVEQQLRDRITAMASGGIKGAACIAPKTQATIATVAMEAKAMEANVVRDIDAHNMDADSAVRLTMTAVEERTTPAARAAARAAKIAAKAASKAKAAAASLPFRESSWQRVLAAELIRRALLGEKQEEQVSSTGSQEPEAEATETITEGLVRRYIRLQSEGPDSKTEATKALTFVAEEGSGAAFSTTGQHPVFFDHRIRQDGSQVRSLQRFVKLEVAEWSEVAGSQNSHGTGKHGHADASELANIGGSDTTRSTVTEDSSNQDDESELGGAENKEPLELLTGAALTNSRRTSRRARTKAKQPAATVGRAKSSKSLMQKLKKKAEGGPDRRAGANAALMRDHEGLATDSEIEFWLDGAYAMTAEAWVAT